MNRSMRSDSSVGVDAANPGQFFACCGILELAGRLWPSAEGWFESPAEFCLSDHGNAALNLRDLLHAANRSEITAIDEQDAFTSPLKLGGPFNLRLDWWTDKAGGGAELKTWAGQQSVFTIARAMRHAAGAVPEPLRQLLDHCQVVCEPGTARKYVEPFYFDSRRAAQSLDIGFSPDVQGMAMGAYPAVEFLCLIGLQRFRPRAIADVPGTFEYHAWKLPLPAITAAACAGGCLFAESGPRYLFRLLRRDNQGRYKAFNRATLERSE